MIFIYIFFNSNNINFWDVSVTNKSLIVPLIDKSAKIIDKLQFLHKTHNFGTNPHLCQEQKILIFLFIGNSAKV